MPLVRISTLPGRPADFGRKIGDIVYRTMVETINVPPADNFQVITEHDRDHLVSLVEVKKEHWSFGNGAAQYAE